MVYGPAELLDQMVNVMEQTEELVDHYATAEQFAGAYYATSPQRRTVEWHRSQTSHLGPQSPDLSRRAPRTRGPGRVEFKWLKANGPLKLRCFNSSNCRSGN